MSWNSCRCVRDADESDMDSFMLLLHNTRCQNDLSVSSGGICSKQVLWGTHWGITVLSTQMNSSSAVKQIPTSHASTCNVSFCKTGPEFRAAVTLGSLRYTCSMMSGGPFLPTPCQGALILQELHQYKNLSNASAQRCSCSAGVCGTCNTGVHNTCSVGSTCTIEVKGKFETGAVSRGECRRGCPETYSPTYLSDQCSRHFFPQHPTRVRPYSGTWMPHSLPRTTTIFDFFWEQAHAKVGVSMQGRGCSRVLQAGQEAVSQQGDHLPVGGQEEPSGSLGPVQFLGCYRVYL